MTEDDVIREVRAAREAFAASHGFNVRAMVTALRRMDEESGVPVVNFAQSNSEVHTPTKTARVIPSPSGISESESLPSV
jgi:hypothetical protein